MNQPKKKARAAGTATGLNRQRQPVRKESTVSGNLKDLARNSSAVTSIKFKLGDEETPITVYGRYAWCLDVLKEAGAAGCTPIEYPAPRWSEYVRGLREEGVNIETFMQEHGGTYAGKHGRYILRSKVRVLEITYSGAEKPSVRTLSGKGRVRKERETA